MAKETSEPKEAGLRVGRAFQKITTEQLLLQMMKRASLLLTLLVILLTAVHVSTVEGLPGLVIPLLARYEDTIYAPGFSDGAFRGIRRGMSEADVTQRLPRPLGEVWFYNHGDSNGGLVSFTLDRADYIDSDGYLRDASISIGATKAEVQKVLGEPRQKSYIYSKSRGDNSYHVRAIVFRGGMVTERIGEFYLD